MLPTFPSPFMLQPLMKCLYFCGFSKLLTYGHTMLDGASIL
ncbi:hypothetical protein MtrunA17_Chr1g0151671 [Medicago truncatula]|uniref:Uncharacterized protein n=1 Tax=Medicago truncatula TaxID=3880 RepID=A0A396JKC5_MEDTR|nr:hypothetical protein MtrunA17_Chr1g0151671 [Medicago truncatula]